LYLIANRKPNSYMYSSQAIQKNILRLVDKGWDLVIQWIPSHCDVEGNDVVDHAANEGRQLQEVDYPEELDDIYHKYVGKQKSGGNLYGIGKVKLPLLGLLRKKIGNWFWCRHGDRKIDTIMTGLRIGRVSLNKYLSFINLSPTSICPNCSQDVDEDCTHYLLECDRYNIPRQRLATSLHNLGITNMDLTLLLGGAEADCETLKRITEELATYIKATKRFEEP
ncbi:unnamed protein product, partial [Meganyctiphanes norvegica]